MIHVVVEAFQVLTELHQLPSWYDSQSLSVGVSKLFPFFWIRTKCTWLFLLSKYEITHTVENIHYNFVFTDKNPVPVIIYHVTFNGLSEGWRAFNGSDIEHQL